MMSHTTKHMGGQGTRQESESRLQRILDTVVAFVGTLTKDGVLTEANEPALAVAGLERKDVIGKPFWDCYWWSHSPEVQERLREAVRQAAAGETVRYDVDIRVAGGALITIDFQLAPLIDDSGKVVELIPSGFDVTERKQTEEQLRRSHDTFFNLIHHAPFGVYIVDADFRLAQISAGAQKVFSGIQPLIGRDFEEILRILWSEPFVSEAIARFRHTLASGEPFRSTDMTEERADSANVESYDWQIERVTLPTGKFGVVCYFYELTDQRRVEKALAQSEAAYRIALRAARSGAWEWEIAEDRVSWSPEVGEMLAISIDRFPRSMTEFLSFVHGEDRTDVMAAIQKNLWSGSQDYEIECRMQRGDKGGLQWVRGSGRIERNAEGNPTRIIGLVSDIDELRRTQQVAHERNLRIENLLNSTAEGIYGIDPGGNCTFANPACARMLGFDSPAELTGQNMHGLVHHHHADGTPNPKDKCRIYQSFQTGERIHVDDEVFWRKDGSSFPIEYWSYPIDVNGRIIGSVVTFLDITSRKVAEQSLRTAAERLGLALAVGEMGVLDWDLSTDAVEWSDYCYTLAGYEIGEITPSYEAWRVRVHAADLAHVEDVMRRARNDGTVFECSYRFQHPDGKILHVVARGRFFYSNTGRPVRMIGVLDDLTQLKAAEEHREMLMGELNHRVKNTLASIQAMASHTLRNASSVEAFRDTFIGRLRAISSAHEILFANAHAGARLTKLISSQVGPYADVGGGQVRLDGPDITLDPTSAHALGLVLHELATNASKYGALSNPSGRIDITWKTIRDDGRRMVCLAWREEDGPQVHAPARKGFGSRLIEQTLTHSLAGEVELRYDSEGFNAVLKLPMEADHGSVDARAGRRG